MEPLDPFKNEGSSGPFKRRISSILKAPRKSIIVPEPEQQENVVECAKPGEKRNSRRVSFAPANDVLLFSKDVKNASPARSPLQELMTATAADSQNRVQFAVTENGNQQITGMETLLKAPLHTFQQRDMVIPDAGVNFGEKTVMFSTDDAFMDMTHSHTINIANDADVVADISMQNYHILPTGGEKMVMFTTDDRSMDNTVNTPSASATLPTSGTMDLRAEKKNTASSMPSLDSEFASFLAGLSKPSRPNVNPAIARSTLPAGASSGETNNSLSQRKTQQADVDKENQAPSSVPAVFDKTINESIALFPEDDASMDMTEAQTGRIQAFTDDDDDPFQCLFPSQEMYSQLDGKMSRTAEKNKQQQSRKTLSSSNVSKEMTSLRNPPLRASLPGHRANLDTKDEYRDKTIRFTAGDDFMDMTQSHTVNIASGSFPPPDRTSDTLQTGRKTDKALSQMKRKTEGSSTNGVDLGFKNFLASLSKSNSPSDNPANATGIPPTAATPKSFGEAFKRGPENDVSMTGPPGSDDPFQYLFPTKDMNPNSDSLKSAEMISGLKNSKGRGSSKHAGTDTSLKSSLRTNVQRSQVKFDSEDDQRERTVRFSADDGCMDETRSHTVNIVGGLELQPNQNLDCFPAFGEKTVRFTANDAAMDMTQSHTVNIAAELEVQSLQHTDMLPPCGETTVRFTANDAAMDMTQCLTVNIARNDVLDSVPSVACDLPGNNTSMKMNEEGDVDVSMDMTEAQTGRIFEMPGTDASTQKKGGMKSQLMHSGGSSGRISLNTSVMASLRTKPQRQQAKFDSEDDCGEKTLRFTADDAAMDVTRSHTVNIATNFIRQPHQSEDTLPACGEKTMRFNADDAAMDMTRSLTVNIAANFKPQSHQMVDGLPPCGEKTLRFSANDAAMDETRSHTVNIAANLKPQLQEKLDLLPSCGENTMRFTANDAAMDVTKSHTVNIATNFEPQPHKTADVLASCGEKTLRFSANDAAMDVTQCLTVNIARNSESDSVLLLQESNISSTQDKDGFPLTGKRMETEPCHQHKNRSLTAHTLDPGFKKSLPKRSGLFANSGVTKAFQETVDPNGFQDQPTQSNYVETETAAFVSVVAEEPVNKTMTEYDVTMDITEAQTGQILRETCTDEYPQGLTSTQGMNPNSDHFRKTEMTSQDNEAPGSSISEGNKITNRPDSLDSNESDTWKESEPRLQTGSLSKKESSPAAVDHDVDAAPSRKSRRMSLADLHSKMRRLSHLINTAPDTVAMDSCTAPLLESETNMDQSQKEKTKTLPVVEPELETGLANPNENTQEQPSTITTTPFNLKTKQLISRLSVGSFKAKLPQRAKPDDQKKMNPVGEHTRTMTLSVTNQLNNFDADVSDINDEELDDYEDMSETIDSRTPQKTNKRLRPSENFNLEEPLQDDVFEQDFISAVSGKKRPLPVEENNTGEDEKRIRASTEMTDGIEMGFQSPVDGDVVSECDGTITTATSMTTQNKDYSNISHTGGRCDATFESTSKQQSLFESQLEEYASDIQRKFDEGSITVSEFFKLFNIDFVIHTPRQSVNPGRLMSDTDCTPMDVLKDRHIFRPKQMVYESDVLNLTEKVEGLKVRMRDLDKPLRIVNRALWEEMRNASEKELKSFGAKLKERNNFFRKTSKVQSHGTKEILYLQLVQANLEEQQKLRGRIEEADEMIKSLDDCIHELEAELAGVEEKGSEDRQSLKSTQEELLKATETLADNDRQLSELEMQKTQNSNKLTRLKTETKNLESRVTALNMLNEWRFGEKRDDCTVYTFLYETFHLLLEFDKSNEKKENVAENQSERKISNITFKLQLDDEKSQDHARLVQKLLSEYIEGETSWVERYPTSRHVPTLLHDVGLVVSRCRLLGEEVRLLKMWGGLKLNILNISCVDTRVHIVFSSLKTLSKFEVILSVRLTNQLCVLEVQSFRNMIGGTTIEQIEEIVGSFSPARNLLTKIVKKIHESLLC